VSTPSTERLKAGTVSPMGIVFMVVATAAPLAAMGAALPLVVALGNGVGAPGTYLLVAAVLALFAVGYAAMSTHIVNPGAFYAYISSGMGRGAGVGSGLVAALGYNALTLYVLGVLGYFSKQTFAAQLGWNAPWWIYSAIALGIALTAGVRGMELNTRVLGVILTVETSILVLFDIVSVARHGVAVLPVAGFDPATVFSGSPGIALLFAVTCFIGFEATAIFAEEARDPYRTIPRATYLAITLIGAVYVLTAWVVVGTNGGTKAGEVAAANPGTYVFDAIASVLGRWSTDVVNWLLLSSLLAVLIAVHNMSSRYLLAFGREGVLPRRLARTHPTLQTPVAAAVVQASAMALIAGGYAIAGADPYLDLGSQMAGLGTLAVIVVMALCSFSVPCYFARKGPLHPWKHLIAPVVAGVALAFFAYLVVSNYKLLTGSTSPLANGLPVLIVVVGVSGVIIGIRQPQHRPLDSLGGDTPQLTGDGVPKGTIDK
jgi:amino acid transporter